ncbi:hypothetical protein VKT23_003778 [Stygiomarasmius scandens]|uniref:Carbohydrate esterase family 16 protein n=1 Tax=Marasmiellus scandens TaxID=2682957 RepID=A0ABR1K3X5_9AGAR
MSPCSILLISVLLHLVSFARAFDWDSIKYVYAFGDSYSFVQGTAGFPNFSFIGDALDLAFTPEQLLADQIVPHNTSSDGSNWLEFLTGCFQGPPSNCNRQLWDFAYAGADIDAAILPRHHDQTTSLVEQVSQWAAYASSVIPHPSNETITFWWIGINDTGDTLSNSSQLAFDNGLTTHLFINVPPEERSPGTLSNPTKVSTAKEHIDLFNGALANHASAFSSANPDATVMTFDSNAWFNMVLDDPSSFGFTNVTGFCTCADPTGFFWFNTGHPTEQVHRLLAEAIENQLVNASASSK